MGKSVLSWCDSCGELKDEKDELTPFIWGSIDQFKIEGSHSLTQNNKIKPDNQINICCGCVDHINKEMKQYYKYEKMPKARSVQIPSAQPDTKG